jgi:UDP-galactopyranose mutase
LFSSVRNICLAVFAKRHDVLFVEEPVYDGGEPRFVVTSKRDGLKVAVPHLPHGTDVSAIDPLMRQLLDRLIEEQGIENFIAWYYTPMMLGWNDHLRPLAVVYDCMDQLSAFKNAPPELHAREAELFARADLVFTGGEACSRRSVDNTRPFIVSRRASTPNILRGRLTSGPIGTTR